MSGGAKISVIVPVYGVEQYLPRCLDSILTQSHQNLEVILVDDGSPDRSGEICEDYAGRDGRIRVIHQKNRGVSAARNSGLAAASGEWIGWVDGDDTIDPDMYAYLLGLAEQYHVDLVQCGILWEEHGHTHVMYVPNQVQRLALEGAAVPEGLWSYFSNSSCCKLFRRSKIAGLTFDSTYQIGEDVLFNLSALALCGEIILGNRACYHYWQNQDSACHTAVQGDRLTSMRRMFQYAEGAFAAQEGLLRFCRIGRLRNNLDICSKIVCNHIGTFQRPLVREIRSEMRALWREHFAGTDFSKQERLKCFLIGYFWALYQFGLPRWKSVCARSLTG